MVLVQEKITANHGVCGLKLPERIKFQKATVWAIVFLYKKLYFFCICFLKSVLI